MDFLVVCSVLLVCYLYIKRYGRIKGGIIKIHLPPPSNQRWREARIAAILGLGYTLSAVMFLAYRNQQLDETGLGSVLLPFVIGMIVSIVFYFSSQRY